MGSSSDKGGFPSYLGGMSLRCYTCCLIFVLIVGLLPGGISSVRAQKKVQRLPSGFLSERWGPFYPIRTVTRYGDAGQLVGRDVYRLLVATNYSYDSTGHLKRKTRWPLVIGRLTAKWVFYYPNGKRQIVVNRLPHTEIRHRWDEKGKLNSVTRKGLWGNIKKEWANGKMIRERDSKRVLRNIHYQ